MQEQVGYHKHAADAKWYHGASTNYLGIYIHTNNNVCFGYNWPIDIPVRPYKF